MKIRVTTKFRRGRITGYTIGEVLDVPEQDGLEIIALGYAEQAGPETAVDSAQIETSVEDSSRPQQ